MPWPIWLGLGGIVLAAGAWGVASAVVPTLNDPNLALSRLAKKMTAGPSSGDEAKREKEQFDT